MERIRICFVTHLPNLTGASQSLLDLLDGIDKDYFYPIVLVGKKGVLLEELEKRGIEYHYIPYSSEISTSNKFINFLKHIKSSIAIKRIERFYRKKRIDIVHNNSLLSWAGMQAASNLKIPYVCHVRELLWEDHRIKLLHEKKQFELMCKANLTVFISKFVENYFVNKFQVKNYLTLFDGLKVDRYLDENHKEILSGNQIKILLAGRIAPGKGQLEAVKAMEILNRSTEKSSYQLKLVGSIGDQSYYDAINNYIEEHHLDNISLKGFADLTELRKEADITLMCSSAEGLGRVTIESMLSGCLLIAADAGATKELVFHKKTGLLYESGNPFDLAKQIEFACQHSDKMNEVSNFAQQIAKQNYNHEKYGQEMSAIYNSLVNK